MTTNSEISLIEKLVKAQTEIKAPKNQWNAFGKYKYRNAEDIQESAKPILADLGLALTLSDTVVQVSERYYVQSTASVSDGIGELRVTAFAREDESRKGMTESQVTGCASSYARKYALGGLFLLDDTKDDDSEQQTAQATPKPAVQKPTTTPQQENLEALLRIEKQFAKTLQRWCELNGSDFKRMGAGVKSRPDFERSISYYTKLIKEFSAEFPENTASKTN